MGLRCGGFDDGQAIMFTRCLADPACATLYRDAVDLTAFTIDELDLDALADSTAALLRPWQVQDPRREQAMVDIDAAVAGVHAFMRLRAVEAAAWLTPPVVIGVPDRAPNDAGWFNAPVTIDWQATDLSGPATDPPATVASTDGANVTYTSALSCDPSFNCATGSVSLSIDTIAPALAPTLSATTILLHGTVTATPHASDDTSGVLSQSCGVVDTGSAGLHSLSCTAIDNARQLERHHGPVCRRIPDPRVLLAGIERKVEARHDRSDQDRARRRRRQSDFRCRGTGPALADLPRDLRGHRCATDDDVHEVRHCQPPVHVRVEARPGDR